MGRERRLVRLVRCQFSNDLLMQIVRTELIPDRECCQAKASQNTQFDHLQIQEGTRLRTGQQYIVQQSFAFNVMNGSASWPGQAIPCLNPISNLAQKSFAKISLSLLTSVGVPAECWRDSYFTRSVDYGCLFWHLFHLGRYLVYARLRIQFTRKTQVMTYSRPSNVVDIDCYCIHLAQNFLSLW